jgi:hypothetical protein
VGVLILGVLIVHGEGFIDGSDDHEADGLLLTFLLGSVGFVHGIGLLCGFAVMAIKKSPPDVEEPCVMVYSVTDRKQPQLATMFLPGVG